MSCTEDELKSLIRESQSWEISEENARKRFDIVYKYYQITKSIVDKDREVVLFWFNVGYNIARKRADYQCLNQMKKGRTFNSSLSFIDVSENKIKTKELQDSHI